MSHPGISTDPSNNKNLKLELAPGAAGAVPGAAAGAGSPAIPHATNGAAAGGTADGSWPQAPLGAAGVGAGTATMAPGPMSLPPLEAPKTRKKGLSVACPIAYGSLAFLLERKKQSEFVTHKWTLFVRGPSGEDISYFVSKVVFTLHPSFAEATREVTSPPFEVTEMGWGEFEAKMTMHFKDPEEKPVDVLHQLRLYHDAAAGTTQPKKAVVAEFYDEVVFTDPYEEFYTTLMKGQTLQPQKKHENQDHLTSFSDGESLQRLASAREWVHNQLRETKDKIRNADMDMARIKAAASAASAASAPRGQNRPVPAPMRR